MASVHWSPRVQHWIGLSALWAGVAALLWVAASAVLASDRGLDLGDEGLYLLAADPPSATAAFVFPFGWHTRPLFTLVGYDIAAFRTAGAVVLALTGAWVALGATRMIAANLGARSRVIAVAASTLGLSAAWFYYITFIRVPGYNWVTLVGSGIAVGAALRLWAQYIESRRGLPLTTQNFIATASILSFGVMFTAAAKPTTPVAIMVLFLICALVIAGPRRAIRTTGLLVALCAGWIVLFIMIRWWPVNFFPVFWDAIERPPMSPQQAPLEALNRLIQVPFLAYRDFRGVPPLPILIATIGLVALASNVIRAWNRPLLLLAPFGAVLITAPFVARSNEALWEQTWGQGRITVALLLVVTACLLLGLGPAPAPKGVSRVSVVAVVSALIIISGMFGFASTNTPYPLMKLTALLLAGAALVPLARVSSPPLRTVVVLALAGTSLWAVSDVLIRSADAPYAGLPMAQQTRPTTIGSHGAALLLDDGKATAIQQFRSALAEQSQTPPRVIGAGANTPGLVFSLGSMVPESLVLSWYEHPGAVSVAQANRTRIDPAEWCGSWVVLGNERPETLEIATTFTEHVSGMPITTYGEVSRSGDFLLLRPTQARCR